MNNKIKYILATILIISSIVAVSAAIRQPNDYFAFASTFINIEPSQTDDNIMDLTFTTYYIPLTGSATYTLTVTPITASINISQPNQINTNIKNAIVSEGISRGYNIKKIVLPAYNILNP